MKNRNLGESIVCAARGMYAGFKTERNFKTYSVIAFIFLVFNMLLSSGIYDYALYIILTAAVFVTEYINTAIERVVDKFGDGIHEDYRFIKDVAAGAVLTAGVTFLVVEGMLLLSKLFG